MRILFHSKKDNDKLNMITHQLPTLSNDDTFENAICDLFNEIYKTSTFKRFGRKGHQQKGIDIFSSSQNITIQCKKKDVSRKDIVLKKELFNDIEKDVKKTLNSDLKISFDTFYIVSTFKDHPDLDEYCEVLKEELNTNFEIVYWGWETLEKKFLDSKKLLEKYWTNFVFKEQNEITILKRNLDLKKKITKDFSQWLDYDLDNRKVKSRMLLRKYNSNQYPVSNKADEFGEYPWYRAELKSLYFNGVEFILGAKEIQIFPDSTWDFVMHNTKVIYKTVTVYEVGQINFSDIIEYDVDGDEYKAYPHFYCNFKYTGTPFEKKYCYNVDRNFEVYEFNKKRT